MVPAGRLCICEEPLCAVDGKCVDPRDISYYKNQAGVCGGAEEGGQVAEAVKILEKKQLVECSDESEAGGAGFCSSVAISTSEVTGVDAESDVVFPATGGQYAPNLYAILEVRGPAYVDFERFNIQQNWHCKTDYLRFNERSYCGSVTIPRITVPVTGLRMEFNSDAHGSGAGFAFKVTSIDASALDKEDLAMITPDLTEYCSFGRNSCTKDPTCTCPAGFTRNEFVVENQKALVKSTPIDGSDKWWSCSRDNMHTCDGFCCCIEGFAYTRAQACEPDLVSGTCYACSGDPDAAAPTAATQAASITRSVSDATRGAPLKFHPPTSYCAAGSSLCNVKSEVMTNGDVLVSADIGTAVTSVDFYVGAPSMQPVIAKRANLSVSWLLQLPTHIVNPDMVVKARWPHVLPRVQVGQLACNAFAKVSGAVDGFINPGKCGTEQIALEAPILYYKDQAALTANEYTNGWLIQEVLCGTLVPEGEPMLRVPKPSFEDGVFVSKTEGGFVQPLVFAGSSQNDYAGAEAVSCESGGAMPWGEGLTFALQPYDFKHTADGQVFAVLHTEDGVMNLDELLNPAKKSGGSRSVGLSSQNPDKVVVDNAVLAVTGQGVESCAAGNCGWWTNILRCSMLLSIVMGCALTCFCLGCCECDYLIYEKEIAGKKGANPPQMQQRNLAMMRSGAPEKAESWDLEGAEKKPLLKENTADDAEVATLKAQVSMLQNENAALRSEVAHGHAVPAVQYVQAPTITAMPLQTQASPIAVATSMPLQPAPVVVNPVQYVSGGVTSVSTPMPFQPQLQPFVTTGVPVATTGVPVVTNGVQMTARRPF
eukprot:TRINITY_DN10250_c0_g1_i2.p1 TRINITY_DN10250_c0_g1~~TRINITY_DN10250_c0_g1_i2.p1  ORF type:complete len:906 (-),score=182.50 TRINITY_DN10250_c0_g1_i2:83-2548(-)